MDQNSPNMTVEYIEDTIIVTTLTDEKILEDSQIQALESSFLPLIEKESPIRLIIDFTNVKFLTSSVLGLLIRISKKIYESQGRLGLCCIQPKIFEIFKITRLDKIFEIYTFREGAVDALR